MNSEKKTFFCPWHCYGLRNYNLPCCLSISTTFENSKVVIFKLLIIKIHEIQITWKKLLFHQPEYESCGSLYTLYATTILLWIISPNTNLVLRGSPASFIREKRPWERGCPNLLDDNSFSLFLHISQENSIKKIYDTLVELWFLLLNNLYYYGTYMENEKPARHLMTGVFLLSF